MKKTREKRKRAIRAPSGRTFEFSAAKIHHSCSLNTISARKARKRARFLAWYQFCFRLGGREGPTREESACEGLSRLVYDSSSKVCHNVELIKVCPAYQVHGGSLRKRIWSSPDSDSGAGRRLRAAWSPGELSVQFVSCL